jgi:hypothetical protein
LPSSAPTSENFPVAGWFIAARHRPLVRAYYAFARQADDIADSPDLSVIQKLGALDTIESELNGTASSLGSLLRERDIPLAHAADLLIAFRADARNTLIRTFDELLGYCRHSAAPVGRFLLALHREKVGANASDALCTALQILNHVQDARADAETLKRCYIPLAWLNAQDIDLIDLLDPRGLTTYGPGYTPIRDDYTHEEEGGGAAQPKPVDPAKLRACLNKLLDEVERLLIVARPLPGQLKDRGLAAQAAMIHCLAGRLSNLLRANDPWQFKISLRLADWFVAALVGLRTRMLGP